MRRLWTSWLLLAAAYSPAVFAQELYLHVFLGDRALQGIAVELDGTSVGDTGSRGEAQAALRAGEHSLALRKNEATLATVDFSAAEGESAEISVTFTDFAQAPQVEVATFDPAAPGDASGRVLGVVDDPAGNPVAGAFVSVDGRSESVVTDAQGNFSFELPRGEYGITIDHPDYRRFSRDGIRVVANIGVAARVQLQPAGPELDLQAADAEEVIVFGTFNPEEDSTSLEQFSIAITDAIDIEDLLRFGDSDVAATLKRLVGVSVTGGKYAVVRGLDGRYISATLNDFLIPSTDPFRRDVQLDLFPSDILGGIEIQKGFTADLPGETTGGVIKIKTRDVSDEPVRKISVSLGYVDGVTGEKIASYEGSDTDFFGADDGLRELPGAVRSATNGGLDFSICQEAGQQNCVQPDRAAELATLFPNIWNPQQESVAPEFGLALAGSGRLERSIGELGLYGTASFDQSTESRLDYTIDDLSTRANVVRDTVNTSFNTYFVASLTPDANWDLSSRTMLLRDTEDTTEIVDGFDKDDDRDIRNVLLEWVERQFLAQQFNGTLYLPQDQQLDLRLGLSQTTRYAPDRRVYEILNGSLAVSTVERSYSDLTENGLELGADYSLPLEFGAVLTDLRLGALVSTRTRDQALVRIGVVPGDNPVALNQDMESLLAPENFANGAFELNARSTDTDTYEADQDAVALYLSTVTELNESMTLVAGLRQDNYAIDLRFPNEAGAATSLESDELLPALGLTYRIGQDFLQFRAGYSATVSRPNITELAPSRFFDENGRQFSGCPTCQASTIDNFDLRAEYYYNSGDSLTLALFTKKIDQPMEVAVADGSGSATSALTFRNNESATVTGIEIDFNDTLLDLRDHLLKLGANIALIDSEIELSEVNQRLEADSSRELQGQSPLLANLQLSYDHFPSAQALTLLVNYFDDRIDAVTRNLPPIKESGRVSVNLNYSREFGNGSKLGLKLKNLLDAETEYTLGGRTIESYRKGMAVSASYSFNF